MLFGKFRYQPMGILDRTHLHLYTFATARELLHDSGFEVALELVGSDRFGVTANAHTRIGAITKGMLAYNEILVGKPITNPRVGEH